jgi:hypothetical protein
MKKATNANDIIDVAIESFFFIIDTNFKKHYLRKFPN